MHKWRWGHDLRLLCHNEVSAAGDRRQLSIVGHRRPYGHAVLQVVVGPDVNDLIECPQLGVPERSQLGVLLP